MTFVGFIPAEKRCSTPFSKVTADWLLHIFPILSWSNDVLYSKYAYRYSIHIVVGITIFDDKNIKENYSENNHQTYSSVRCIMITMDRHNITKILYESKLVVTIMSIWLFLVHIGTDTVKSLLCASQRRVHKCFL